MGIPTIVPSTIMVTGLTPDIFAWEAIMAVILGHVMCNAMAKDEQEKMEYSS
ncbi:MAG: hypothetical protein ACLFVP_09185 [Candidatus Bathyarchaeia archaeon]